MSLAHIGGVPLEEALLGIAPAAGVMAIAVRARLRGFGAWRRRP